MEGIVIAVIITFTNTVYINNKIITVIPANSEQSSYEQVPVLINTIWFLAVCSSHVGYYLYSFV
jgi:hypothetical protein